ncbi:hypothetical protein EUX98_g1564 [Antrodiella citrinella]|uniref:Uncharacterized protein n=1 Tax=Antrodiella citrinella TaxID=2447956 RepID=A0A4S4N2Q2_9APHY|nr:hypothetical protein EUX98_g1564 [Antrodiella citrinella]
MLPTLVRLSKASRKALTPKQGNKDFYKGTRQAFLPGGPRTGAPGKHVVKGKAKYRLVDEQVRYFVAPSIEDIESSQPIQVRRELSEYSGQTIAVDAYVWLHRGTYSCATELATGKRTTRYVDYAMHRVRLLKHHGIVPYIVFDGGPLPAKKGTEVDRKQRRDENMARANSLAAQGKHSQAREYYVKCIDVTPQMAFQLIKALRAESVAYVVAPYEADAQMAYLERTGVVHGILTEDSDLLVFGCKNVLLKMDAVENTVISVVRSDFGSLNSPGGISLLGWTDVQFRAMAILSGCDYLPSIPGIGLKTAWSLLKKHKTVENVVRALRMEGKKDVPKGYLEAFKLAETVFLHQRVYDPTQEMLVHLTEVQHGEEWDEEKEAHVGSYIEPSLAKKIAQGDACPISLLPMDDINPTFIPRTLKPIPMNILSVARTPAKGKGKARMHLPEKAQSTSILNFFNAKPSIELKPKSASQPSFVHSTPAPVRVVAGRSSGKRTLAEVMDQEVAAKKKKRSDIDDKPMVSTSISSKFFRDTSSSDPKCKQPAMVLGEGASIAGSSRLPSLEWEKENIAAVGDDDDVVGFSEAEEEDEIDPVTQEEGYLSPTESFRRSDTPELSSPVRPRRFSPKPDEDDNFGADVLSSPPVRRERWRADKARRKARAQEKHGHDDRGPSTVLVADTPPRKSTAQAGALGPDLRDVFEDWNDLTSEIDECCDDSLESAASSRGPITPEVSMEFDIEGMADMEDEIMPDEEEIEMCAITVREERVASGWWEKYARGGNTRPGKFPVSTRKLPLPMKDRTDPVSFDQQDTPRTPQTRNHNHPRRTPETSVHPGASSKT